MFTIKLLILLAVATAAFTGGWAVRGWKADSERAAELAGYIAATKQAIAKDREHAGRIGKILNDHAAQREQDRLTFEEKLRRVSSKSLVRVVSPKCSAERAPEGAVGELPGVPVDDGADRGVVLTGTYIGLHNDALSVGATEAERAARADAKAEGAGVSEPKDVLVNLRQNAERWAECRAQLRGFQAWACRNGLADPALCEGVGP